MSYHDAYYIAFTMKCQCNIKILLTNVLFILRIIDSALFELSLWDPVALYFIRDGCFFLASVPEIGYGLAFKVGLRCTLRIMKRFWAIIQA